MKHLLVRHQVADFDAWKPGYDEHRSARQASGLRDLKVMQGANDRGDVVLLFEVVDESRAREFIASSDLASKMRELGVVGEPTVLFLDGHA
ncbi:hypothetical protein [Alienimonas chondri]|uniref:Cyclase n=1 Tax=Alienimonas chondri TaxID=2681879 RepID=A0ABX1VDI9_9PLAN|nr:hypothetical protein [Alienimonas chondri]NNJ25491.1 hypothetical protein [Alienimonas chondri]